MLIRAMQSSDLPQVKSFTDRAIGMNYYALDELAGIFERSSKEGRCASLVLVSKTNEVFGVRLSYPPGNWESGKGRGLCPQRWRVGLNETAYFQSLFIDPALTSQGWGKKMSLLSISILKSMGAKAVVTHSWRESPEDSSGRYLRSLGFEHIQSHPLYWFEVDYQCTRCGKPCVCTADEMILYIENLKAQPSKRNYEHVLLARPDSP